MLFGWSTVKTMCDIPTFDPPSKMSAFTISRNFNWQKKNHLRFSIKFGSHIENQGECRAHQTR